MSESIKTCWIVTEGLAGTENQCLGLAAALGVTPVVKRIALRAPWRFVSPWLRWGHDRALTADSDRLDPPFPDLLIASGRKSVGVALDIKKRSGGRTFLVQVQDPRIDARHFDLVVVPQHDPTRGENVLVTTGALHRVTPAKLAQETEKFTATLGPLPRPRLAVLIGGTSRAHRLTAATTEALANALARLAGTGAGLMITASRRTGDANAQRLRERLGHLPGVSFWDGSGENPYFAMLGWADHIVVTEDSVSMTSEALSTGKPVYTVALEGGARRLDLFHSLLQEQGYTRPFTGVLETWSYAPLRDTLKAADEIRKRMEKKE